MESQADGFEQTELPYKVRIENFEGPLDLLLHLIKKNEINIYDIPVAMIIGGAGASRAGAGRPGTRKNE